MTMDRRLLKEIILRFESAHYTVGRELNAAIQQRTPENLTLDQSYLLRYIRERGTCTSTELADFFLVGKSSITAIVTRLVDKGLLQRQPDSQDRRVTHLSLTPEGEDLISDMDGKIEELLSGYLNHFDDREALAFIETYEKLASILKQGEGSKPE